MRFAELQSGGGAVLRVCTSAIQDQLLDTGGTARQMGLKKKVDGQIDEAALFIESHTRQSITPCFSSAYLSHNRCALSVFLR